jgi:hypothetical protein
VVDILTVAWPDMTRLATDGFSPDGSDAPGDPQAALAL